ncbi:MAG: hypothetical protein WCH39_19385, partial [Schlesneria sp.]
MIGLLPPLNDPTSIFEHFRGSYGSELLTAAVGHFRVFERLSIRSMSFDELRQELGLQRRPAVVLITALRAMKLIEDDQFGNFRLTDLAKEHLIPGGESFVGDYVGLA